MAFSFTLPLRIAQALIAVIILGLMAYGKQNLYQRTNQFLTGDSGERLVGMVLWYLVTWRSQLHALLRCLDDLGSRLPSLDSRPVPNCRTQVRHSCGRGSHHDILVRCLDCTCCPARQCWV